MDRADQNLKQQTVTGVLWSAGARAGNQVQRFAVTVVLARLLVPEDFGLVAMVTVFTGFAALFVDFGLAPALVQRPSLTEAHRSSAFWMNIAAGFALAAIVAALGPALAALYGEPSLVALSLVLSLNFVLSSVTNVQGALLQRRMDFGRLGQIEIWSTLAGGVVAIGAAAAGYGVWSLVFLTLTTTGARGLLLWLQSDWRPHRTLDRDAIRELWHFSRNLGGYTVVNYWSRNADNFLIGKFVGAAGLGIYGRAYNLMLMPLAQISAVIARVMFPALSRISGDRPRVKRAYLRAIGIVGLLGFPAMAGLFVVAEPFVHTLYGPKWAEVVPILQILCVAGLLQPVGATAGWIYVSQGRTDWLFRWGLVSGAVTLLAFAIGINWGVEGVAVAYAVSSYALLYPSFSIPGRLIDMRTTEVFRAVRGVLVAALVMAASVWLVGIALPQDWPSVVVLLGQLGTGVVVYGVLVHTLKLKPYLELRDLVRERRDRRQDGAEAASESGSVTG